MVLRVYVSKGKVKKRYARVAQLVEYDLAKVGVAGSSPVSRSIENAVIYEGFRVSGTFFLFT